MRLFGQQNGFWQAVLKFYEVHEENELDVLTYNKMIESLTLEDIQKSAKKYLSTPNVATFILYPENWKER